MSSVDNAALHLRDQPNVTFKTEDIAGWGAYPRCHSSMIQPRSPTELLELGTQLPPYVARGNGRSYGDAAVGRNATIDCRKLNRMQAFDPGSGLLNVESGVLLADIIDCFLPRGFFPQVVPGTKFVTVGGMIAADVHGKNHHKMGGFGASLEAMDIMLPSGERTRCSRTEYSDLFTTSIGGMGLTGTIISASFKLRPVETGWIRQKSLAAKNLNETFELFENHEQTTYSVAWIDCLARGRNLGRSLVYLGEHASKSDLEQAFPSHIPAQFPKARRARLSVPFNLPNGILNRHSIAVFNELYFRNGLRQTDQPILIPCDKFFFPLDGIHNWNRIYGAPGFVQHQSVFPNGNAQSAIGEILTRVAKRGLGSFLAVIKKLSSGAGLMSFPMQGYTLAMDFPASREVFGFLDELDRFVVRAGGRLYLAKDARQSRDSFEKTYDAVDTFRSFRRSIGADKALRSYQSERIGI